MADSHLNNLNFIIKKWIILFQHKISKKTTVRESEIGAAKKHVKVYVRSKAENLIELAYDSFGWDASVWRAPPVQPAWVELRVN